MEELETVSAISDAVSMKKIDASYLLGKFIGIKGETDTAYVEYVSGDQTYVMAHLYGKSYPCVLPMVNIDRYEEQDAELAIFRLFQSRDYGTEAIVYTDRPLLLTLAVNDFQKTVLVQELCTNLMTGEVRKIAVDNACFLYQIAGKDQKISVFTGLTYSDVCYDPKKFVSLVNQHVSSAEREKATPLTDTHVYDQWANEIAVAFVSI